MATEAAARPVLPVAPRLWAGALPADCQSLSHIARLGPQSPPAIPSCMSPVQPREGLCVYLYSKVARGPTERGYYCKIAIRLVTGKSSGTMNGLLGSGRRDRGGSATRKLATSRGTKDSCW